MRRLIWILALVGVVGLSSATYSAENVTYPRPSGNTEAGVAPGSQNILFQAVEELGHVPYDLVAQFPKGSTPEFEVQHVLLNGKEQERFIVANNTVFNGGGHIHGSEDFTVSVYAGWQPGQNYELTVEGQTNAGAPVKLVAAQAAPAKREAVKSLSYGSPTAAYPYHHAILTLAKEAIQPGVVVAVEVDGKKNRDPRFFNVGVQEPSKATKAAGLEGETSEGKIEGSRDFQIIVPVNWANGSKHKVTVRVVPPAKEEPKGKKAKKAETKEAAPAAPSGPETVYESEVAAPATGGYWNAEWPHAVSFVLHETVGILRLGEPVHLNVGLFADDVTKPENEIRVITYDPTNPKAGTDGYVVAPSQVTSVSVWRDERLLNSGEKDAETGEPVHRYDATTSVELVFLADVQPYQEKVYQVVYGNPKAEPMTFPTELKVAQGEGLSQTIENAWYKLSTSTNSGAVETVTVLGQGDPVLLEHKLETNGAVHWNPGIYSPPTPWVHASDWETPVFDEITGPLMHRTRRYAPLPHMDSVEASVSYEFYTGEPYIIMASSMEVNKDMFVQALRNGEIVFNHAVLNEFVWLDPLGKVEKLEIESSRKHPIHALEIPAKTPWMAFINREKGVGFASIALAFETGNRYGQPPSEAQPYFYVQNGPWIYWARPIVYPFGGMNFTRMMPVRAGSFFMERNAWVPFKFAPGDDPFATIESLQQQLTHPLLAHEWMATDDRTPDKWVMPILVMPFNEGVAGAVSGHKDVKDKKDDKAAKPKKK